MDLRANRFMWNTFLDFRFEVTPVTVDNHCHDELDGQAGGAGVSDDSPPRLPTIRTIRYSHHYRAIISYHQQSANSSPACGASHNCFTRLIP